MTDYTNNNAGAYNSSTDRTDLTDSARHYEQRTGGTDAYNNNNNTTTDRTGITGTDPSAHHNQHTGPNTGVYNSNTSDRTGLTDSTTHHNQHTGTNTGAYNSNTTDRTGLTDSTTHHGQHTGTGTGAYNNTTDRTGLTDSSAHHYDNDGGRSTITHGSHATHHDSTHTPVVDKVNPANPSHVFGVTSAYIPPASTHGGAHREGGVFDHPDDSRTGGVFDKRDGEQEPHGHHSAMHDNTHHDTHGMGTSSDRTRGTTGGVTEKLDPTAHIDATGPHAHTTATHTPQQHASIADKVVGKVEQVAGKITHNPGLAEKGELRATMGKSAVQDYHPNAGAGTHDTHQAAGAHVTNMTGTGHKVTGHEDNAGTRLDNYPAQ